MDIKSIDAVDMDSLFREFTIWQYQCDLWANNDSKQEREMCLTRESDKVLENLVTRNQEPWDSAELHQFQASKFLPPLG